MKVLLSTILSVVMLSGCTTDGSTEVQPFPRALPIGGSRALN